MNHIHKLYENKNYGSAIFLDISQVFDQLYGMEIEEIYSISYNYKMLLPFSLYEVLTIKTDFSSLDIKLSILYMKKLSEEFLKKADYASKRQINNSKNLGNSFDQH